MANQTYETPKEGVSMDREYSKSKNAKVPGSGVYRHPESGQEAIVQSDPLWGNTQAQAFARLGFKFVREAKEGEIKTLPELAMDTRKAEEDSLKGLSARLGALETVAEDNKTLTSEVEKLREDLKAAEQKAADAEKAQADAEAQIKEAGEKAKTAAETRSFDAAKNNASNETDKRENGSGQGQSGGAVNGSGHEQANVGNTGVPGADKKTNKESGK